MSNRVITLADLPPEVQAAHKASRNKAKRRAAWEAWAESEPGLFRGWRDPSEIVCPVQERERPAVWPWCR